jgi:hypothetical protein
MVQLLSHLFGDYILQSDWMAQNKTKRSWPAFVHALLYSLCFVPLCWDSNQWLGYRGHHLLPFSWMVIFGTHFLIDRFRLARYVVWTKNFMGPWTVKDWAITTPNASLSECPTGYPPATPIWLSVWLLIVADNTLHLSINYLALGHL